MVLKTKKKKLQEIIGRVDRVSKRIEAMEQETGEPPAPHAEKIQEGIQGNENLKVKEKNHSDIDLVEDKRRMSTSHSMESERREEEENRDDVPEDTILLEPSSSQGSARLEHLTSSSEDVKPMATFEILQHHHDPEEQDGDYSIPEDDDEKIILWDLSPCPDVRGPPYLLMEQKLVTGETEDDEGNENVGGRVEEEGDEDQSTGNGSPGSSKGAGLNDSIPTVLAKEPFMLCCAGTIPDTASISRYGSFLRKVATKWIATLKRKPKTKTLDYMREEPTIVPKTITLIEGIDASASDISLVKLVDEFSPIIACTHDSITDVVQQLGAAEIPRYTRDTMAKVALQLETTDVAGYTRDAVDGMVKYLDVQPDPSPEPDAMDGLMVEIDKTCKTCPWWVQKLDPQLPAAKYEPSETT